LWGERRGDGKEDVIDVGLGRWDGFFFVHKGVGRVRWVGEGRRRRNEGLTEHDEEEG
jgi:hypothetical protein